MSHIGCLCGHDVRENNQEVVHTFVSDEIMHKNPDAPFFGLDYGVGLKASIWRCDACDRLIFFDDRGPRATRIMRRVDPAPCLPHDDPSARPGVIYNEEHFFDAVDEHLTDRHEKGLGPDYEFFGFHEPWCGPALSPRVMRGLVFENDAMVFPHWSRAVLADTWLAVLAPGKAEGEGPFMFWECAAEDMEFLRPHSEG